MPRGRLLSAAAVGALALIVAGCQSVRTVSHSHSLNDVFGYVYTASLPLEVVGNPYPGAANDQVAAAAAHAMSGLVSRRRLDFVAVPPDAGAHANGYRVVLFLSGGGIVAGERLCAGRLPTDPAKGGSLHASAALCQGAKLVAWAEGWGGPVPAVPDATFAALMDRLIDAVFKRETDRENRNPTEWPEG
ncbi:hypothetical protein [Rhodospira trueperi]|uniref:DUF4136 domain-containing protein n=1 Tax=Rhodospira trueperi TaxID=69960 RepID=A0A1G7GBH8_9PROT|nr:hypothetical protein [Rhodospira trueperi]SDE85379.1 hypothetical protein SAMN05421720_11416 [Rhodospira trueperi]